MTQAAIELSTTPPYPGLQMVQDINKALEALGTDFAGTSDPVAFAKPFMTWADTGNMLEKRRNAAGTAWVIEGDLLRRKANRNGDVTQKFNAAPSEAANDVVVQSQAYGVGQTRQSTSKTLGSNYTNLSGRPRDVSVLATSTVTGQFVRIISVTSGRALAISRSSAAGQEILATTTIFNNETYLVEASLAYTSWLETA